jgi:UDP-N-acetylglucosamine transferase subunit ALG13
MSHRGTYILARQESPESCLSIFSRCKQYQDGNDGSVKTFRELSINVSTNVVNETENRLLKSGKDNFLNNDEASPKPHQTTLKRNLITLKRKVGNA